MMCNIANQGDDRIIALIFDIDEQVRTDIRSQLQRSFEVARFLECLTGSALA